MKFFISYSSTYRAVIAELEKDLEAIGYDVWFDQELEGGQLWWDEICKNIRSCDLFLLCLSPEMLASEPCRLEYTFAHELGKPIFPLVVNEIETHGLPDILSHTQFEDFTEPRSKAKERKLNHAIYNAVETIRSKRAANGDSVRVPDVENPPVPYVSLEAIRESLEQDEVDPITQDRISKALRKEFIGKESGVEEAYELLLVMARHAATTDVIRGEVIAELFRGLGGVQRVIAEPELLRPELQKPLIAALERYHGNDAYRAEVEDMIAGLRESPGLDPAFRRELDRILLQTVRGVELLVANPAHITPDLHGPLLAALEQYYDDATVRTDIIALIATLRQYPALDPDLRRAIDHLLVQSLAGLTVIVQSQGQSSLETLVLVVGELKQYVGHPETRDEARELLAKLRAALDENHDLRTEIDLALVDTLDAVRRLMRVQDTLTADQQTQIVSVLLENVEQNESVDLYQALLARPDVTEETTAMQFRFDAHRREIFGKNPEYARWLAYKDNDRAQWRQWADKASLQPIPLFLDAGLFLMLGITAGILITLFNIQFGEWQMTLPGPAAIDIFPGYERLGLAAVGTLLYLAVAWRIEFRLIVGWWRMLLVHVLAMVSMLTWTQIFLQLISPTVYQGFTLGLVAATFAGVGAGFLVGMFVDRKKGVLEYLNIGYITGTVMGLMVGFVGGLLLMLVYGFRDGGIFLLAFFVGAIVLTPAVALLTGLLRMTRNGAYTVPESQKET